MSALLRAFVSRCATRPLFHVAAATSTPSLFSIPASNSAASRWNSTMASAKIWSLKTIRDDMAVCAGNPVLISALLQSAYAGTRARPDPRLIGSIFDELKVAHSKSSTFPSPLDCEVMMKTLSKNSDTIGCKKLYESIHEHKVTPTDLTMGALIGAVAKAGNMMEGMRLVDEIRRHDGNVSVGFSSLLSGLVHAGFAYQGVESVFERAQACNAVLDTRAIAIMVTNSVRAHEYDRAEELIKIMKRQWDVEVKAAAGAQRSPSADLKPSAYPYVILLSHLIKRIENKPDPKSVAVAEPLSAAEMQKMQKRVENVIRDCQATVGSEIYNSPATLSVIISFYLSTKDLDKALALFTSFRSSSAYASSQPDIAASNVFIQLFIRANQWEAGLQELVRLGEAFKTLKANNPNDRTKVDPGPTAMLFSAVTKTESTTPADTSAQSVMDSARPILNGARVLITAHKVGLPVTATHVAWTYKNLGQVIASIKQNVTAYPDAFKTEVQQMAVGVNALTESVRSKSASPDGRADGGRPASRGPQRSASSY